jgi:subtilase family protein
MVFVPVGNRGFLASNHANLIPDMFDGESDALDDPQSVGVGASENQISPPATAKNIISVGANGEDAGINSPFNLEETVTYYTAKGPATNASRRTAPMMTGVGDDIPNGPIPYGMYTVMSDDNSNDHCPVNTILSDGSLPARGTSFATASVASAAAIVEDYFHQGFYPAGYRSQGDRVPSLSGSAVKAILAASANFAEEQIGVGSISARMDGNDFQVATTRSSLVPPIASGLEPAVLGNNQQGFGRVVISQALPINNWPPTNNVGIGDTLERPSTGLLVWDYLINGEPPINAGNTVVNHDFNVVTSEGQLRVCLAWPDPPGEMLVNDLDLELIDPNGKIYDGNVYNPLNQKVGQWGLGRTGPPDPGDANNNLECIHLSDDPNGDWDLSDGQVAMGQWTVRVKQGSGGTIPGTISMNDGPNEDANNNHCLDSGEDLDADGLLDTGGQTYSLVAAGAVTIAKDSSNPPFFSNFPQSFARLDKDRYACPDNAQVLVWDPNDSSSVVNANVVVRVFDPAGHLVDTETNLTFSGAGGKFMSAPLPVRQAGSAITGNRVLEGSNGYTIEVSYADPTPASRIAIGRATLSCRAQDGGGAGAVCKGPACTK